MLKVAFDSCYTLILYQRLLKFNVTGFLLEHHENSQVFTNMMKKIYDILSRGKNAVQDCIYYFYISTLAFNKYLFRKKLKVALSLTLDFKHKI